jgi:membrane-associated protease RseP (regulator of RpoE activity)
MESIRAIPPLIDAQVASVPRRVARPTLRQWIRHGVLFVLTAVTTTLSGLMFVSNQIPEPVMRAPVTWLDYLLYVPLVYLKLAGGFIHLAATHPPLLAQGVAFAGSLLAILMAHEFGHYIACRRYGVEATLPFFLPSPPLIGPGTFGAFIKIKSPIPSRRALFDIGLAGPLAGFVVIIPVAIIGLLGAQPAPPIIGDVMYFNDPLLMRLLAKVIGVRLDNMAPNALYMSAWIGLLVTSLNLLPVGQLDGGHGVYALFGVSVHKWLGRFAFVAMTTLAVLGWDLYGSPSGFLFVVVLAVMLRVGHPQPQVTEPLGGTRIAIAFVTLLVFALSFWPFPFTLS